jgi:hypothetical protein
MEFAPGLAKELYRCVKNGQECAHVLKACGARNYQVQLQKEPAQIHNSEMWRAGPLPKTPRAWVGGSPTDRVSQLVFVPGAAFRLPLFSYHGADWRVTMGT